MEITDKIALITGGSNGIGFAIAEELLRNGAGHVSILDLEGSNGTASVDKLNTEFGSDRAIFIACDVTNPVQFEDGFKKTIDRFGGLDIVVNNAGIGDEANWELMVSINFIAVARGTLLGLRYMGKNHGGKGGVIVNVASIFGLEPGAPCPMYTGTKHAVVGVSRSFGLPIHYAKSGVRVLVICPGFTRTKLITPSGHTSINILSADEIRAEVARHPIQNVDNVALGTMTAIRFGKTGSVWVTEGEKPAYEVQLLSHQELPRTPVEHEH